MIIRILGEGQFAVPDAATDHLNLLDADLQSTVDNGDPAAFNAALGALLAAVRGLGRRVPDAALTASDLVLPAAGSALADVAALLGDEGLVPG